MPILTVTNLTTSDIQLQDPIGTTGFSVNLPAGQTKSYTVSLLTAVNMESLLEQSAGLGRLSWSVADNPASKLETGVATPVTYTRATLPAANTVPAGFTVYLSDSKETIKSDGTNWRDLAGDLT